MRSAIWHSMTFLTNRYSGKGFNYVRLRLLHISVDISVYFFATKKKDEKEIG